VAQVAVSGKLGTGSRSRVHGALRSTRRAIAKWPLGAVALAIIGLIAFVAAFADLISPHDPLVINRGDRFQSPNANYLLGTDASGRDQFSRLLHGSRVSIYVGILPVFLSATIGTLLGIISAQVGGTVDAIVQRLTDALMAIPALVIALTMVALLGPSINNVVLAITVVTVPALNRVARGAALAVLAEPYVEAATSLGASRGRIIFRHVLPNIMAPMIIVSASLVGVAILAEAGLSFLGLGVPPPRPTWGNMLGGENRNFFEIAPWLAIFPGLAITLAVLSFNILGDTLRDALDPRTRNVGR